jgi:hypothetical protein
MQGQGRILDRQEALNFSIEGGRAYVMWKQMMHAGEDYINSVLAPASQSARLRLTPNSCAEPGNLEQTIAHVIQHSGKQLSLDCRNYVRDDNHETWVNLLSSKQPTEIDAVVGDESEILGPNSEHEFVVL